MKTYNKLYLIRSKSGCDPDKMWLKDFNEKYFCSECNNIKPQNLSKIFDVVLMYPPDRAALNVLFPPWINVARQDFLSLFEEEVNKYLKLGHVFNDDGKELKDFLTFTSKKRLPIRGNNKSRYRGVCENCGSYNYSPKTPFNVLKESLFNQPLYVPWGVRGMVLTEELKNRIDRKKWKGIVIYDLPILDEPRDGFDEIPVDPVLGEKAYV